jgi:putative methanogenesis marker protein 12
MFLGIDHGTTAIRFSTPEGRGFEIPRREAAKISSEGIVRLVEENLGSEIGLAALSYSMGDGLTRITRIEDAPNRGLRQQDGAGLHVGGGTRVFDAVISSGWPAVLLPGIHRGSDVDFRLKVFSHGMSPEKVGLAYFVLKKGLENFIVCDASSNTVTFAVHRGRIMGALDASVFAPGLIQGPLDVDAIRAVDAGKMTANEAFNFGGILPKLGYASLAECPDDLRSFALESLGLFAAMEISAMKIIMKDVGEPSPAILVAGDPSERIRSRVSALLDGEVLALGKLDAAIGCAMVAKDVFYGAESALGIEVDEMVRAITRKAERC